MTIIRSIRAELNLGDRVLDCYELPSGEKRIGIAGTSIAIGRNKNYLGRLLESDTKPLKGLQGLGFTGYITEVEVELERGTTRSKTISTRDFTKVITWDAIVNKNTDSIVLLASFAETGIEDTLDRLFKNQSTAKLLERIVHYKDWTANDFWQALQDNKKDWELIAEQEFFNRTGRRLFDR
jgi:copper chaperone CopZ